jgi:DNA-binding YbaB/EbfC family protein
MEAMQSELADLVVEGRSGGGMVTVSLSGKGELKGLKIDPSLFREDDVEVLEDLIVAAHADAKAKSEAEMQKKMAEVTSGLPLPPGMKLPF